MTALCVAVVLGRIGMDMDMDMVIDVDVDTDMAREVLEATATDARLSDRMCRTLLLHAAMRLHVGVWRRHYWTAAMRQ
jgi:hypothetical protein